MAKSTKTAKAKKAPKTKAADQFEYIGEFASCPVWDGQIVSKGVPFTPKDPSCASKCEASPYFKKA